VTGEEIEFGQIGIRYEILGLSVGREAGSGLRLLLFIVPHFPCSGYGVMLWQHFRNCNPQ
jgi:hypothetical protein